MENGLPWWDGLMSPAEAEELDRQGRVRLTIAEYLARPKPETITLSHHGPWNPLTLTCLTCGKSELDLYYTTKMPKCLF